MLLLKTLLPNLLLKAFLRLLLMCVLSWISVVVCLGVVRTIRGVGGPFGLQGIGGGGGGP